MTIAGLKAAKAFGAGLPAFSSAHQAKVALFALRDEVLRHLTDRRKELDDSPESLKVLEAWYLDRQDIDPVEIGFYFGEVLCRNAGFEWTVTEYAFDPGRYELGVRRNLLSLMLTKGRAPMHEGNRRQQSLWREYQQHAL